MGSSTSLNVRNTVKSAFKSGLFITIIVLLGIYLISGIYNTVNTSPSIVDTVGNIDMYGFSGNDLLEDMPDDLLKTVKLVDKAILYISLGSFVPFLLLFAGMIVLCASVSVKNPESSNKAFKTGAVLSAVYFILNEIKWWILIIATLGAGVIVAIVGDKIGINSKYNGIIIIAAVIIATIMLIFGYIYYHGFTYMLKTIMPTYFYGKRIFGKKEFTVVMLWIFAIIGIIASVINFRNTEIIAFVNSLLFDLILILTAIFASKLSVSLGGTSTGEVFEWKNNYKNIRGWTCPEEAVPAEQTKDGDKTESDN